MKITTTLGLAKKIDRELKQMKSKKIRVGIIGEEANTVPEGSNLTILEYATLNEYGTTKIPARPFFRTATQFGDSPKIINDRLKKEILAVIKTQKTGDEALEALGLFVKGRIQTSIKRGIWAPNKDKSKKKNKRPLIDTGSMLRAVDFEIVRR